MSGLGVNGLPPVDPATLPAAVRDGGQARQEQYRAALAFERVLVGKLTEQVFSQSADEGGSAAVALRRQQLPETLADAIVSAGGLGIAAQLDASWQQSAGAPKTTSLTDATAQEPSA